MKKILAMLLALAMIFALAACGQAAAPAPTEEPAAEEPAAEAPAAEEAEEPAAEDSGVMSYADFVAAELDSEVVVETYVQAKQSWWEDQVTVYCQDPDGAYFLYNMACSEADNELLVPGQKIRVTGYKSEWSGEVEIVDASFELVDGDSYIAEPSDVTALLGSDALATEQNKLVSFNAMTIVPYDESGAAFAYKNEADKTDDLYFKATMGDQVYDFCVEYYLCNEETEVYKAVEALNVGDVVDMTGFLYWYEGPNPHIVSVVPHEEVKGEGVMSYAEYAAAETETEVTIEAYVQAKQSWWDDKATVYCQDPDGAYFLYNMACSEADYDLLTPGTKIRVTGYKTEWSGEIEIADASFEILDGFWLAIPEDVTELLGSDALAEHMNQLVSFSDMTVEASDGDAAFLYNYDGSGEDGNDLYFKVSDGKNTYTFTVESYLCPAGSEVYEAVKALNVGDVVDLSGFLYWYEGPNPHITSVVVK